MKGLKQVNCCSKSSPDLVQPARGRLVGGVNKGAGERGGEGGGIRPEKTAGATHPKTTQRQPEAAQPNAYAKFKAIRSRKRAPGWAERAFAMLKNGKKKK